MKLKQEKKFNAFSFFFLGTTTLPFLFPQKRVFSFFLEKNKYIFCIPGLLINLDSFKIETILHSFTPVELHCQNTQCFSWCSGFIYHPTTVFNAVTFSMTHLKCEAPLLVRQRAPNVQLPAEIRSCTGLSFWTHWQVQSRSLVSQVTDLSLERVTTIIRPQVHSHKSRILWKGWVHGMEGEAV